MTLPPFGDAALLRFCPLQRHLSATLPFCNIPCLQIATMPCATKPFGVASPCKPPPLQPCLRQHHHFAMLLSAMLFFYKHVFVQSHCFATLPNNTFWQCLPLLTQPFCHTAFLQPRHAQNHRLAMLPSETPTFCNTTLLRYCQPPSYPTSGFCSAVALHEPGLLQGYPLRFRLISVMPPYRDAAFFRLLGRGVS